MGQNRDLPFYTKTERIEVAPAVDVQSPAQALINSFQQFSQTASSAERLFIKYETDDQRQLIRDQVAKTYQDYSVNAMQQYADKNQALKAYDSQAYDYGKRYLENTPYIYRNYARNVIDYFANAHRAPILKNTLLQNKRVEQIASFDKFNQDTDNWENAIANSKPGVDKNTGEDLQFQEATSFYAQQQEALKKGFLDGTLPLSIQGYEHAKNSLKERFISKVYLKKYQDHVENGTGDQFLKDLADPKTNIEGFNEDQKSKLIGQLIKVNKQQKQAALLELGNLKDLEQAEIAHVENGAIPDSNLLDKIRFAKPQEFEKFNQRINIAQHVYSAKQAALYQSPNEVKEQIDSLLPKKDDPMYAQKLALHDAVQKGITKFYKDYANDPMKYVLEDPTIKDMVNNYYQAQNAGALGTRLPGSPVNNPIEKPWNRIIQMQLNNGLSLTATKQAQRVKLLNSSDANSRIAAFNASDAMQKVNLINKWNDEFGGGSAFNIVMRQLIDKGLPKQAALLTYIEPGSPDAHDVVNAFSRQPQELHKMIGTTSYDAIKNTVNDHIVENSGGTSNFQSFLNSVTKYSSGKNVDFYQDMTSAVTQLAMFYKASNRAMSEDEAVKKAENVIASRYQYPLINGDPVRVPHKYTPDSVVSYANHLKDKVGSFPFVLPKQNQDIAKMLIMRGHWANDGIDHGLVWVDENGALWRDKNGQPFGFSFDDAENYVRGH